MNIYPPTPNVLTLDLNGIHIEYKLAGGQTNPCFRGDLSRDGYPIMIQPPRTSNAETNERQAYLDMDYAEIRLDQIAGTRLTINKNTRAYVPEWDALIEDGYICDHVNVPDDLMKKFIHFTLSEYERFLVATVETIESGVRALGFNGHAWIFALEREMSIQPNLEIDLDELAHAYRTYQPTRHAIRAAQTTRSTHTGPVLKLTPHTNREHVTFIITNPDAFTKTQAEYQSREFLDDIDEFDVPAGWLIGLDAVAKLLTKGYGAAVFPYFFTSETEFRSWFASDAIVARKTEETARLDKERIRITAKNIRIKAEREQAGQDYEAWRTTITLDRVRTDLALPGTLTHANVTPLNWSEIRREHKTTPGTWYDTGDVWYEASFEGETIYKRVYGNANPFYVSETLANRMALNYWHEITASTDAKNRARTILEGAQSEVDGRSYIGSQEALRIVQQIGTETILEFIATCTD